MARTRRKQSWNTKKKKILSKTNNISTILLRRMKKIHQWIQIRHYCEGSWHPYVVQSYCVYPCISKWHFRHHVLRRTSQTSVVMAEIKQHLSQNSLWLPHILTSGIGIGAKERKKVNICNELQLFLKQAQKRLIYLKYLKSLAWWFNYLWKPGHNLEWERLSRYWNEMQMFFFSPSSASMQGRIWK